MDVLVTTVISFFLTQRQGGRTCAEWVITPELYSGSTIHLPTGNKWLGGLHETDYAKGRVDGEDNNIHREELKGWEGKGKRTTLEFYGIISRHYLPETSKQNSRKLVRKPNFCQCYVLKSRSVFLYTRLSYGKLSFSSFQAPSTCNETLSNCYTSHVICCTLGSQEQRND